MSSQPFANTWNFSRPPRVHRQPAPASGGSAPRPLQPLGRPRPRIRGGAPSTHRSRSCRGPACPAPRGFADHTRDARRHRQRLPRAPRGFADSRMGFARSPTSPAAGRACSRIRVFGGGPASAGVARRSCHVRGCPAYAGVVRRLGCELRRRRVVAPHTRGWSPVDAAFHTIALGCPAYAGVVPPNTPPLWRSIRLPRIRGGGPHGLECVPDDCLVAPHARGWSRNRLCRVRHRVGCPACAGGGPRMSHPDSDHGSIAPHARGWSLP